MNTKVINLFGGSGLGKSTTAAGLFYHMKLRGIHCELVREYVKDWAWDNRKVGPMDQPYLFGKQARRESMLYGKVEWIVTDSPLWLSPMYETFYTGGSIVEVAVKEFLNKAKAQGVEHVNIMLKHNKPFDPRGRYETADQAKEVDKFCAEYLEKNGLNLVPCDVPDEKRISYILTAVGL